MNKIKDINAKSDPLVGSFNATKTEQDFSDALFRVNDLINKKMKRVRASKEQIYPKGEDKKLDARVIIDLMDLVKNQIHEMVKVMNDEPRPAPGIPENIIRTRHVDIAVINTEDWVELLKEFKTLTTIMIRTINNWKLHGEQRNRGSQKES